MGSSLMEVDREPWKEGTGSMVGMAGKETVRSRCPVMLDVGW